jgi:hypothetical protein
MMLPKPIHSSSEGWLARSILENDVANHAISSVVEKYQLPRKDFSAFARLHIPIAFTSGQPSASQIQSLISTLAHEENNRLQPIRTFLYRGPDVSSVLPRSMKLVRLEDETAKIIFEKLHYIRSHRPHSRTWGLLTGDTIVAAACVSRFDLNHIQLPSAYQTDEIRVLSRVYAFENAPVNTLSRLFSLVAKAEKLTGARLLLTYVNPNLGFSGASYRAANWNLFGFERGTRYQYVDGRYITDRFAELSFGAHDPSILSKLLGNRHRCVMHGLLPLSLFAYSIDTSDRHEFDVRWFRRP